MDLLDVKSDLKSSESEKRQVGVMKVESWESRERLRERRRRDENMRAPRRCVCASYKV
jgi:hypothetical protein